MEKNSSLVVVESWGWGLDWVWVPVVATGGVFFSSSLFIKLDFLQPYKQIIMQRSINALELVELVIFFIKIFNNKYKNGNA
ncbi:MAG: hypothetical protein QM594_02585 [Niabella sp.]